MWAGMEVRAVGLCDIYVPQPFTSVNLNCSKAEGLKVSSFQIPTDFPFKSIIKETLQAIQSNVIVDYSNSK